MAAGFIPKQPYPGAQKRWRLHCTTCDSTVYTYASSIRDGHSCPKCAGRARLSAAEAARIAKRANKRILGEYKAAYLPVSVECLNCGAKKDVSIASLKNSRGTCDECKPSARLSADEAVALMLAAGMEPLEPYRNARTPWRSKCVECGEIGTPRFANIRAGQRGCRSCNYYGYDITAPAILYVLINREHDAVKVGVTNQGSLRLRNLSRGGWKPGKVWEFPEGRTPLHVETLVLRRLRGKGLRQAVSQRDMPGTRGATETFRRADIAPRAIYRWVDAMAKQFGYRGKATTTR